MNRRSSRSVILVVAAIALGAGFALVEMGSSSRRSAERRFALADTSPRALEALASGPAAENDGPSATPPLARPLPSGGSALLDAAAREKLRATIWGALGEPTPATNAEAPAAAAYVLPVSVPDPPGDPGKMEPGYIQERVRNDFFPFAKDCYAEALKAHADLSGDIVLRFIIVGDAKIGGIVESVDVLDKSTLRDPAMIECIRESFLGTKFPAPEHGGWVSVEYPISFSPDEDDGDD